MLLSIIQGYKDSLILDIEGLSGIHAAGVPGGFFSIQGVALAADDVIESHRWRNRRIGNPDTLSLRMVSSGDPTAPDEVERSTSSELRQRIDEIFKGLESRQEGGQKNQQPEASETFKDTNSVKVLKNGESIFELVGEHVQFDIDWDMETGCKLLVWGYESYDENQSNNKSIDLTMNEGEEYVIRFGS